MIWIIKKAERNLNFRIQEVWRKFNQSNLESETKFYGESCSFEQIQQNIIWIFIDQY